MRKIKRFKKNAPTKKLQEPRYFYKNWLSISTVILALILIGLVFFLGNRHFKNEEGFRDPIAPFYKQESNIPKTLSSKVAKKIIGMSELAKIQIPVVMYHYVEYVKDPGDTIRKSLDINPHEFDRELKILTENGYQSYFVRDIPRILNEEVIPAKKSVILTFDDGYEDFYTDAFPILKKYNVRATIYIIVNFIGRRGFLNNQEIKEIAASGLVEIGSHTLDHAYLKKSLAKYAQEQIFDSKTILEKRFGIKVDTFAYPYGAMDEQSIEMVKEASYSAAVSVMPGNVLTPINLFYLPRIRAGYLTGPNMIQTLEKTK